MALNDRSMSSKNFGSAGAGWLEWRAQTTPATGSTKSI